MITKTDRICKRPTTVAERNRIMLLRVKEALEREEGMGVQNPSHLLKMLAQMRGAKA